ncbi:MAG: hypothetical protein H6540_06250 [Bacteroidales bacterium]|nr:hypothetical protein [Bacteroidales bacterium]MCB9012771.1 hypothetical protein [Bacteroidales bacterium]
MPKSVRLDIPVDIFVQEAIDLFYWCRTDKEVLSRAGLDWSLVEELPECVDSLVKREAVWISEFNSGKEIFREWKNADTGARTFKKELVSYFYHAFFNNKDIYSIVRRISKDKTIAGLIQSLYELAELGEKHTEKLKHVGFDPHKLDEARKMSTELSRLYARVVSFRNSEKPEMGLRNQSYLHLKAAVDEIRRVGKFALRENPERLAGYSSDFLRKKKMKQKAKKNKS